MRFTALTLNITTASTTGAVELTFTPDRVLPFRAGQGGLLLVPGGGIKPFTFSGDDRSGRLSIATTLHTHSRFKRALAALQPGNRIRAAGAIGTLPALAPDEPQVLIAQGIGITPFLSMARSSDHLDANLLQVGTPHYFAETAAAMRTAEYHDHREDLAQAVCRAVTERPDAQYSLSGQAAFVTAVAAQLRACGVPARCIHRDTFWGMRATPTCATTPTTTPRRVTAPAALNAG